MANAAYTNLKNLMLGAGTHTLIDWNTDTVKVILVDTADYAVNIATHQDLDDVTSGGRVATGTLASVTITAGVVDAADLVLSSVSGDQSEALVFYKDTGVSSTSTLGLYFDTFASGMPVTPNGGNITISFSSSGIVSL